MPKKVEVDGETYIVSEDVDFNRLDTDNMVQKDTLSELLNEIKAETKNRAQKATEQKAERTEEQPIGSRPQLQLVLSLEDVEHTFLGIVCASENSTSSIKYQLLMVLPQALDLHRLVLRSQTPLPTGKLNQIKFTGLVNHYGDESVEFRFSKEVVLPKLNHLKIEPQTFGGSSKLAYVEIGFATSIC